MNKYDLVVCFYNSIQDEGYVEGEPFQFLAISTWNQPLEDFEYHKICPINDNERGLKGGRLKFFDKKFVSCNQIEILVEYKNESDGTELINWIGNNVRSKWNMSTSHIWSYPKTGIYNILFLFEFEDENELAFFKLTWV